MAAAIPFIIVGASLLSAVGSIRQGNQAAAAAKFQSKQLKIQAGQVEGAASRKAQEEERRAKLLNSTLVARAAASGGSVVDPTVFDLYGNVAQEGRYRALTQLYEGFQEGARIRTQAGAAELEGSQAKTAGYINAGASILGGAGKAFGPSLFDKYGGSGPPTGAEVAGGSTFDSSGAGVGVGYLPTYENTYDL